MKALIPEVKFSKSNRDQLEFEIFTLQSLFSRQDLLNISLEEPHRVDFYHILFITSGEGIHHIDFQPFTFREGSILFISKGQVQAFEVTPDINGFLILFTEDFLQKYLIHSDLLSFHRLYNYYLHSPIIQPEESDIINFRNIFGEIEQEYYAVDDFARGEILRHLLNVILLKAERIKRTLNPRERNSEWFKTFIFFKNNLVRNYTETRNAEDYAGQLNISYKHLNTITKSIVGCTAKKIIDNFVVMEVKRYMAVSNISIKELTYAMGFDEPTNLVKFFKRHTSQTPSQFKKYLTC